MSQEPVLAQEIPTAPAAQLTAGTGDVSTTGAAQLCRSVKALLSGARVVTQEPSPHPMRLTAVKCRSHVERNPKQDLC